MQQSLDAGEAMCAVQNMAVGFQNKYYNRSNCIDIAYDLWEGTENEDVIFAICDEAQYFPTAAIMAMGDLKWSPGTPMKKVLDGRRPSSLVKSARKRAMKWMRRAELAGLSEPERLLISDIFKTHEEMVSDFEWFAKEVKRLQGIIRKRMIRWPQWLASLTCEREVCNG